MHDESLQGSTCIALIAATGVVHGLTVATRNMRDFEDCGVTLFDPFTL